MKKRILAFILCLTLLLGLVPGVFATDVNEQTASEVTEAVQGEKEAKEEQAEEIKDAFDLFCEDKAIDKIQITNDEKSVISVKKQDHVTYQWQAKGKDDPQHADKKEETFADIKGMDSDRLELSHVMLAGLLDENNETKIRCRITEGEQISYSKVVKVSYALLEEKNEENTEAAETVEGEPTTEAATETSGTVPETTGIVEETSETDEKAEIAETAETAVTAGAKEPLKAKTIMPRMAADEVDEDLMTYTVTVEYMYETEGPDVTGSISTPYIATLPAGADLDTTVNSPIRNGYKPYLATLEDWDLNQSKWTINETTATSAADVDINLENIAANVTYYVVYVAQNAEYSVRRYVQNIYDDNYNYYDGITETAKIGTEVPEAGKDYSLPGFIALDATGAFVAADGSTEVDLYYDREYELISFDLGEDAYGVTPIYARYGTSVKVNDPTRTGWIFQGWEIESTSKGSELTTEESTALLALNDGSISVPAYNVTYRAVWTTTQTNITYVYWRQNPDSDPIDPENPDAPAQYSYSFWTTYSDTAMSGSVISGSNDLYSRSEHAIATKWYTYNGSLTDKNVVVKGDGSTVINVYYDRKEYTLEFWASGTAMDDPDCADEPLMFEPNPNLSHKHTSACVSVTAPTGATIGSELTNVNLKEDTFVLLFQGTDNIRAYKGEYTDASGNSGYALVVDTLVGNPNDMSDNIRKVYKIDASYYSAFTAKKNCKNTLAGKYHTVYKITAKYQADISDLWPTMDMMMNLSNVDHEPESGLPYDSHGSSHGKFCGWSYLNSSNTVQRFTTRRSKMDSEEIGHPVYYAYYSTSAKIYHCNYMLESLDQISPNPNSSERRTLAGNDTNLTFTPSYDNTLPGADISEKKNCEKYIADSNLIYDNSAYYTETVSFTGTITSKTITGMTPIGYTVENAATNEFVEYLYSKRTRYTLSFYNVNQTIMVFEDEIPYERVLSDVTYDTGSRPESVENYVPDYPETYEPNAYEFAGWYTTAECYDGTEADFDSAMPDADLTLFAKWTPITHRVRIFDNYDDVSTYKDATTADGLHVLDVMDAVHGHVVNYDQTPTKTGYDFVGWFYMEDGVKKAFKFNNMPVNKDKDIFAEWQSTRIISYQIRYLKGDENGDVVYDSDHHPIEVADPTNGSIRAGMTRSFSAKGIQNLYADYQTRYFPMQSNHSIMFTPEKVPEGQTLIYDFVYKNIPYVTYRINYLESGSNKPIRTAAIAAGAADFTLEYPGTENPVDLTELQTNSTIVIRTDKAITTERYAAVPGYLPDAYQKQVVLSANEEENVINFYYTKVIDSGMFIVQHLVEDAEGNWNIQYEESGEEHFDVPITKAAMTFEGHTYDPLNEAWIVEEDGVYAAKDLKPDETKPVDADNSESLTGAVTEGKTLVLRFFYKINRYPYTVYHKRIDTGATLYTETYDDSGEDDLRVIYGRSYTAHAIDFESPEYADLGWQGFTLVQGSQPDVTRVMTSNASSQTVTFYYEDEPVSLNYVAVIANGRTDSGCYVTPTTQKLVAHWDQDPNGAVPYVSANYQFAGWFTDENCQVPVADGWVESGTDKLIPQRNTQIKDNATYYALFEPKLGSLVIGTSGISDVDDHADDHQTTIYHITGTADTMTEGIDLEITVHGNGSQCVEGLPYGDYTIRQESDWSWRYTPASESNTATVGPTQTTVTFTNQRTNELWMNGSTYRVNHFTSNAD